MARARAPVAEPEQPGDAPPAEAQPDPQADDAGPQEPSQELPDKRGGDDPVAEAWVPGLGSIHERMTAILAELPAIGKDTQNPQQGFMYRSHDDVLNALNPLLAKHQVYVVPEVLERVTARRETARGSVMYEVNLLVRYSFIASDGSWIAGSAWGEGTDSGDKATNKAMTMAFKNVLAQSFAVSTQEAQAYDADGTSPEETVAAGTAARAQARAALEAEQAERAAKRRDRIAELVGRLDVQTGADAGTWLKLTQDGAQAAFGEPYEKLNPTALEEIGKTLRAMLDSFEQSGTSEVPEQIDFTVPF